MLYRKDKALVYNNTSEGGAELLPPPQLYGYSVAAASFVEWTVPSLFSGFGILKNQLILRTVSVYFKCLYPLF